MRLVRFLVATALVTATLVFAGASPAMACDCAELGDEDGFADADAVFIGTPIRFVDARDGGSGFEVTVMRVSDVYKGEVTAEQAVATSQVSSCGFTFRTDEIYVVYGRTGSGLGDIEDGILFTESCTGTRVVGDRPVDLAAPPQPPAAGGVDNDTIATQLGDPRSSLFPEILIFGGVIAFVIGLVAWLNRKGRVVT